MARFRTSRRVLVGLAAGSVLVGSCTAPRGSVRTEPAPAGAGYASTAPGEYQVPDFEDYFRSVILIRSVAYYRRADFWEPPGLADTLLASDFWDSADAVTTFTESNSGTATLLEASGKQVAVVTAAHVISFPDTVKVYHFHGKRRQGIKVIAVKVRQQTYLPGFGRGQNLDLHASDPRSDVAVLTQDFTADPETIPAFPMAVGSAADLEWGTFVYVLGYPTGKAMITSGLVSQPNRDQDHGFLSDIVFNKGMSGGPVFARKRGSDKFECVGLVTSGSGAKELLLVPDSDDARQAIESGEAYEGDAFATEVQRLQYGVTMAVSIETVRKLLEGALGTR